MLDVFFGVFICNLLAKFLMPILYVRDVLFHNYFLDFFAMSLSQSSVYVTLCLGGAAGISGSGEKRLTLCSTFYDELLRNKAILEFGSDNQLSAELISNCTL